MGDLQISKTEAIAKASRWMSMAKRAREEGAAIGERAIEAGSQLLLTPGWGYARTRWAETLGYNVPGTTVPLIPAAAAVTVLAGIGGMLGRSSDTAVKMLTPIVSGELTYRAIMAASSARSVKSK